MDPEKPILEHRTIEKSIFLIVSPPDIPEYKCRLEEFSIDMVQEVGPNYFQPPREPLEELSIDEPMVFRLIDKKAGRSETLLAEFTGYPDINDIRLLKIVYLDGNSLVCFSSDKGQGSWKDGEDLWTFGERADEFRSWLWNSRNIFFRVFGFGKSPKSRPYFGYGLS